MMIGERCPGSDSPTEPLPDHRPHAIRRPCPACGRTVTAYQSDGAAQLAGHRGRAVDSLPIWPELVRMTP